MRGSLYRSTPAFKSGEAHFRVLLDKLPTAAYMCDPGGLITYFNENARQIWGRAPRLRDPDDRFCGSLRLFTPTGEPIAHDECWMALALRRNHAYNGMEIVIEQPEGRRITALAHANPIHDKAGGLLGAVNVLVDITERKQTEDALRQADRAKNEFLATLAHELRNPLAPIRNAVELLSAHPALPADAQGTLDVIERQMRQMTRLIDDLLDVSRLTRNKLLLHREPVDLADPVRSAIEACEAVIARRGHQLEVRMPEHPLVVHADAARVTQMVSNLLDNAAKYTTAPGMLTLSVERDGTAAVIRVSDTGIGIGVEALPHLFELFHQETASLDRTQGGLGVGLNLVKRLAEMHGGDVSATSAGPGKGSTFTITLPLREASATAPVPSLDGNAPEAWALARERAAGSQCPLRILVVDDNRDATATLSLLLRLQGHDTATAYDGVEALRQAEAFRPDVILLDIGLPGMNGYAVACAIRERNWEPRAVLVATTGWGQEHDRRRALDAGFDHHLVKPVDPSVLARVLASVKPAAVTVH